MEPRLFLSQLSCPKGRWLDSACEHRVSEGYRILPVAHQRELWYQLLHLNKETKTVFFPLPTGAQAHGTGQEINAASFPLTVTKTSF